MRPLFEGIGWVLSGRRENTTDVERLQEVDDQG